MNGLRVQLPDRAGELQRANATAALISELGDNYEHYHDFLARELEATGGRPEWNKDRPDFDGFQAKWRRIDDLVQAEAILRQCRAHRKEGRAFGEGPSSPAPFVDAQDRLLSAVTGKPVTEAEGSRQPRRRPPPPPWLDEFFPKH